jgi:hypothetical protein
MLRLLISSSSEGTTPFARAPRLAAAILHDEARVVCSLGRSTMAPRPDQNRLACREAETFASAALFLMCG